MHIFVFVAGRSGSRLVSVSVPRRIRNTQTYRSTRSLVALNADRRRCLASTLPHSGAQSRARAASSARGPVARGPVATARSEYSHTTHTVTQAGKTAHLSLARPYASRTAISSLWVSSPRAPRHNPHTRVSIMRASHPLPRCTSSPRHDDTTRLDPHLVQCRGGGARLQYIVLRLTRSARLHAAFLYR